MSDFPLAALAQAIPDPRTAWLPVVLLLVIALGFTIGTLAATLIIGPSRTGPGKESVYESGMNPIGDARRRFNVRFYLVAMIFLVIDVGIVLFYPWATVFPNLAVQQHPAAGILLAGLLILSGILLVAYFYAWGKGVFRWD